MKYVLKPVLYGEYRIYYTQNPNTPSSSLRNTESQLLGILGSMFKSYIESRTLDTIDNSIRGDFYGIDSNIMKLIENNL